MPKVWITRSLPGAKKSARVMQAAGFSPIIAPLLTIEPAEQMPPRPPKDAVLIVTSQNALNVLAGYVADRHWPLICVGDATAELAKKFGFANVHSVNGTSADITSFIVSKSIGDPRPYWHVSGNNVRGTIVADLVALGFNATRHIFYHSEPVTDWPNIELGEIQYVALYSPMAAAMLRKFNPDMTHIVAVSFSSAVDNGLSGMRLKARLVAEAPTEASLIRALDCAR